MAEPDWRSTELDHRLRCYMVDPTDRAHTLGELELAQGRNSVTWEYYTDTRTSAQVSAVDWRRWVPNSWLRLVHEVPSCGYSRDLFCGFVWDEGASLSALGYADASPSLMSAAKALETDRLAWPLSVGEGAKASEVLAWLCESALADHREDGTVGSYRFGSAHVYDAGDTKMSAVMDICDQLGVRMDVDGRGTVVFSRYVAPASRAPSAVLDCDSPDSMVLTAGLAPSSDSRQSASRVVVTFRDGDEQVSGYADVAAGHPASAELRGYRVTESESPNDAPEPHDAWRAQTEARSRLPELSGSTEEWDVETRWLPLKGGDVVMFRPPAQWDARGVARERQALRKCLVKSCDADLSQWRLKMTLKEV